MQIRTSRRKKGTQETRTYEYIILYNIRMNIYANMNFVNCLNELQPTFLLSARHRTEFSCIDTRNGYAKITVISVNLRPFRNCIPAKCDMIYSRFNSSRRDEFLLVANLYAVGITIWHETPRSNLHELQVAPSDARTCT